MRISDWSSDVCSSDLWWSGKQYDKDIDREVRVLRHAQSIDEDRKTFPRVGWGIPADVTWNEDRGRCDWLRQWWFAGNHSDVGGSYPESESRLSDIALRWMADELKEALGDHEIGRASCRERVGKYVLISVVAVSVKKKKK